MISVFDILRNILAALGIWVIFATLIYGVVKSFDNSQDIKDLQQEADDIWDWIENFSLKRKQ